MKSVGDVEAFQQRARELVLELKAESGLSYADLAAKLSAGDEPIKAKSLANRVQQGRFSAGLAFALFHLLGAKQVTLSDPSKRLRAVKAIKSLTDDEEES